ncbi:hypothetical protein GGR50DRAFT_662927 [Xylaria sp. CBS 124048]|nr:hypothetical protein GGR50DRAFT_662927 [Xylaria sp. CBS 124048]
MPPRGKLITIPTRFKASSRDDQHQRQQQQQQQQQDQQPAPGPSQTNPQDTASQRSTNEKNDHPANLSGMSLLDRHNRTMAAILTRFRNMVIAATEPLPTAAAIPRASLNVMTMNNEAAALVRIALSLSHPHLISSLPKIINKRG